MDIEQRVSQYEINLEQVECSVELFLDLLYSWANKLLQQEVNQNPTKSSNAPVDEIWKKSTK